MLVIAVTILASEAKVKLLNAFLGTWPGCRDSRTLPSLFFSGIKYLVLKDPHTVVYLDPPLLVN